MNKQIGLIIADLHEFQSFEKFEYVKKIDGNFDLFLYKYNNYFIYVIHSRIGLVNAAIATQYLIDCFNVEEIWNYGAVGATTKHQLFDVVIPSRFYYIDVETPWYDFGQIPLEKKYFINSFNNVDNINIGSSNSFIFSQDKINNIKEKINVDLFDMESCAIAQTCFKNNIPFYCVKGISDIIGGKNKKLDDINNSIKIASFNAFNHLIHLINEKEKER